LVTPSRDELYAKALEIFMEEMYAKGMRDVPTPEYKELAEGNYIERARLELMKSPETKAWEEELKGLELAIRQLEDAREKEIAGVPAGVEVVPETLRKFLEIYRDLKMREDQLRDLRRKRKEEVEEAKKAVSTLTSELEKAREEAQKKPAIKIRILQNFKEGIQYFKAGDVIETHNIEWALNKIDQKLAERVPIEMPAKIMPEVPPPPTVVKPEVVMPKERERFLTDVFKSVLSRNSVSVKSEYLSRWRLELPSILMARLEEQERLVEKFAMEVVSEHKAKVELLRRVREREPSVEEVPPEWKKVEKGWLTPNGVFIPEEKAVEEVEKEAAPPPVPTLKPPAAALWRWLFDTYYKEKVLKEAEGGWLTPTGDVLTSWDEIRRWVEWQFRNLPKDEREGLIKEYHKYFPYWMPFYEWLLKVKGIAMDDYAKLSNEEKAALSEEHLRIGFYDFTEGT